MLLKFRLKSRDVSVFIFLRVVSFHFASLNFKYNIFINGHPKNIKQKNFQLKYTFLEF